jgi:hypothetical protein
LSSSRNLAKDRVCLPPLLQARRPYSHIRIVKNPHYWNAAKVAIEAVVFDPGDNLATVVKRCRCDRRDVEEAWASVSSSSKRS